MKSKVTHHLARLYPDLDSRELSDLADRITDAASVIPDAGPQPQSGLPGADEVMLITYGDTFVHDSGPSLHALRAVWREFFDGVFSTVHVLPFFPSSSDGGFAVVSYREVAGHIGTWADLADVVGDGGLMVDLVCNHGSAQSAWFTQFVAGEAPGRDYYVTADPDADVSAVTRPRTHPLLRPTETPTGTQHVWATFSHDQVDFDFANPDVLVEFCSILGFYLDQGATRVRLDAIAYLWKQIGTRCIHLPQTHEVIKLMRVLVEARDPEVLLITETNVPHADNVSYFGDGDEAHVVYNFTLAPLIAWSLIVGRGVTLTSWLGRLESPPGGCSFLNFIASHDGIGLRPVEDLISPEDLAPMIEAAVKVGGGFSEYSAPGGPRPYELNVSLADLLAGPGGETLNRYVVAHALMLAIQGIPALYVHTLLSSPGDISTAAATGHKRDINRAQVSVDEAQARLRSGWRSTAYLALESLIRLRRSHDAFAPESPQTIHVLDDRVVAIERGTAGDTILAIHNMSDEPVAIAVPDGFGTHDLIADEVVARHLTLRPWQAVWLQ